MTPIASATQRGTGFTISLRNLLILLLSIGAGAGLLGRLFLTDPQLSLFIVGVLSVALPFLFAIVTILVLGVRGKRRDLIAWSGCLVAIPIVGYTLVFFGNRYTGTTPNNLTFQSTAVLLEQRLPKQIDEPWVWRELERRANLGSLTAEEADEAIEVLISHMKKKAPTGWGEPLPWQRGFITAVTQTGLVSDPVLFALCDAFYGPQPVIQPLPRVRANSSEFDLEVRYGNTWGDNSGMPVALLWDVNQVLLDGQPLKTTRGNRFGEQWTGRCEASLSEGEHKVEVEVECAYTDRNKMIGLNTSNLPKKNWPRAAKRWKKTVSAPLHVYSASQPIVTLSTDPAQNPLTKQAVRVRRLVAQADPKGGARLIVELDFTPALTIPLSCDVAVKVGEETHPMGRAWVVHNSDGMASGMSGLQHRIESLDPAVRAGDVILVPNPKHIEQRPDVKRIWGQTITLTNVPIERLDLEVGQPAE